MLTPRLDLPTGRWWGRILWKGGAESTQNRSVSYVKASTCRPILCGYVIFHEHALGFLVHNANNYSDVGSRGSGVGAVRGRVELRHPTPATRLPSLMLSSRRPSQRRQIRAIQGQYERQKKAARRSPDESCHPAHGH